MTGAFALVALATLVACGGGGGGGSGSGSGNGSGSGSNVPGIPQLPPATAATLLNCTGLITAAAFSFANTAITVAERVAAGTVALYSDVLPMPEHCRVLGSLNRRTSNVDGKPYATGFEMRLPVAWNGRLFYQGNGGTDGSITGDNRAFGFMLGGSPGTTALNEGFAVISSDGGHVPDLAYPGSINNQTFGLDPQARVDFGYNAVTQLTPMAKNLIRAAYGKGPDRAYFAGCSNGGREGLAAASRLGDQYDGILAGAPAFNWPKAAIAQLWDTQVLSAVSPAGSDGRPQIAAGFTDLEMALVATRILDKCDTLDGVADGIVSDTAQCQARFSILTDVPTCAGTADGSCLTAAQKAAFVKIFSGPRNTAGAALYNSWPIDPGIGARGWRVWKLGIPGTLTAGNVSLGAPAMAFVFSTPPASPGIVTGSGASLMDYALAFNFDVDASRIFATDSTYAESSMSFMTLPNVADMSTLRNRGGKIMVVHGAADPVFSLDDTLSWYAGLNATYAGAANAFARVFPVPGMNHCAGGPATDRFDMVPALVNWVEKGVVPESIIATSRTAEQNDSLGPIPAGRTRPLCAYPKVSRYKGAGSIEVAANFACQ